MRKLLLFISLGIAALLLAAACSRLEEQKTKINIYVRLPEQGETKAGTVAPAGNETRINDLKIWIFLAEAAGNTPAGTLVGYLEPDSYNFAGGVVNKFEIEIDAALARMIGRVDMYVLANSVSTDKADQMNINTSRETLESLVLEGTTFGLNADGTPSRPTFSSSVGLPYSAVGKNLLLEDDYPDALYIPTLELIRAVSKVRVIVSQIAGNSMDFSITGLQLSGGVIAAKEYIFNDSNAPYKIDATASYVTESLNFVTTEISKTAINGCTSPSKYAYDASAMTAQQYEDLIQEGLSATKNELTSLGFCYLRESDKALTGQLSYRFNGVDKTLPFSMQAGEIFSRNSSWTVYFYFFDDSMRISVSGTEWADATVIQIPLT